MRVEEPDAVEQQRDGERHGVNGVEGRPREPGVREVRERHERRRRVGPEVATAQPEDGQRAERQGSDLGGGEREGGRHHEPERREEDEDRVDVAHETGPLLAGQQCVLERPALERAPHRLHHVPEIEAPELVLLVLRAHLCERAGRPDE